MEPDQEVEWLKAQKIEVSVDLVAAAQRQLQFLATVDKNRFLYDGPMLKRAIYRYNACWLPLLAKHSAFPVLEGPLVVPFDCEWIWHCHRLNPVQYKADCEKLYGQILDNKHVVSVVQGISMQQTEKIWSSLYPEEPYELNFSNFPLKNSLENLYEAELGIQYDLASAVKRQSSFFYQVSRPHMHDSHFLQGAVARYKGFLHLIKRNKEKALRRFCVPTYDIDLIWHSHQLHPASYCKDLIEILGRVLEHDDTDSDRTKGKKLDVGFSGTIKQWEETFGLRYWRAGAMYRGNAPSPVSDTPWQPKCVGKNIGPCNEFEKCLELPKTEIMEVNLEFVKVKTVSDCQKGHFFLLVRKSQPDMFFGSKKSLKILSSTREKHVATFQCEPRGELKFVLISHSLSHLPLSKPSRIMGTMSISVQDLMRFSSTLTVEKWFELEPPSGASEPKALKLHLAVSWTTPTVAPNMFRMVQFRSNVATSCLFSLPGTTQQLRHWSQVVDSTGEEIMSLQMRNSEKEVKRRELIGVIGSTSIKCVLAESTEIGWSLLDSHWFLQLKKISDMEGYRIDLRGDREVKLFQGRKLEYEPKYCSNQKNECDFMTAVSFSTEDPYGKAIALLNLKSSLLMVNEEWFALPAVLLLNLLSDILRKDSRIGMAKNEEMNVNLSDKVDEFERTKLGRLDACCGDKNNMQIKSSACGECVAGLGGCGAVHGNVVHAGGCGGCGSGCGGCGAGDENAVQAGGCGGCGGCGAGCGGCGAGLGNAGQASGCGRCGGGACGGRGGGTGNRSAADENHENTVATGSGGCGGCRGGGCGGGACGGSGVGTGNRSAANEKHESTVATASGGCGGCGGGGGCGGRGGGCGSENLSG
ncbi:hypothetical protein H6P81_020225 [Aristolochia fimbriata]|uniref:Glycine-rich domain-containing protein 1 n=1 Tax=Aristolochia fimbriata TaxID=158543 RepID=A0AAV7DTU5_ARIFI|nr:hypothetical protein H6P81_020225 [Aristolochia fimbriata]